MIGFLRKNNNNVFAALVNNGGAGSQKHISDSSSESDASQDVTIQDIKARYTSRQPYDGSCSDRSQNGRNANLKVPSLNLLQVAGVNLASKAPLTSRAKKHSYRSRNDPIKAGSITQAQTFEDCKQAEEIKFPMLMPNLFSTQKSNATFESGSTEMASIISFNNTRGTFRKKMNKLNNDVISKREKQDLKDQLISLNASAQSRNVNIMEMKTNKTEQCGLDALVKQTEKMELYKQYTIDMSAKQQKFEEESQRHFCNTIKKHQQQTEQILSNKDQLVHLMKLSKDQSMDDLNVLRARLYMAKAQGKLDQFLGETQEESKSDEECGLNITVDLKAFDNLKVKRNEMKNINIEWINSFKNTHGRDPSDEELDEIKEQIENFNQINNEYILMKAQMIRQGVIPYNFVNKAANQKLNTSKPSTSQDTFFRDTNIEQLRADTLKMEKESMELEDEIQRLRYTLNCKFADENELDLKKDIQNREIQMNDKNELIANLISEKAIIEQEKVALKNEMEQLRIKLILVKNVGLINNQKADKEAEHQQEISQLQEQNALLKEQIVALQQLQIKTVCGDSFLESKQDMEELPKAALMRDEEVEEIFKNERSSESIIASYISKFENLVKCAEQEIGEATTPLLAADGAEMTEDEPQVVDLSGACEDDEVEPIVREVVEAGTNMSVTPDHDQILEREQQHERDLEKMRNEVECRDADIKGLNNQVVMLEHAIFDREQEIKDQNDRHYMEKTKDFFEHQEAKAKLQKNIDELEEAIRQKVEAIQDLTQQKAELKESHELAIQEKKSQLEETIKEHQAVKDDLMQQIEKLQSEVNTQIATNEEQARQFKEMMAQKEQALKADAELRLKEKDDEIKQLKEELSFSANELQDRISDINKLQIELANQKSEEEKLLKRIEQLKKEADTAKELAEKLAEVTTQKEQLLNYNEFQQKELDRITDQFKDEQGKRKQILNELEDLKGKIRVYCRVRPFSKTESEDQTKAKMCVDINDEMSLTVKGRIDNHYNFDSVFGPDSTQEQVFNDTKRLVQSAIDGFNVCVFAYGQTGSGKTFTIQGTEQNPGLTPRSIEEMYKLIENMKQFDVELSCYMVEIYKGELRDLLLPKNVKEKPKLEVKQNQNGQVQIKNVTIKNLKDQADTNAVFETGLGGRQTRKTLMNDESSRSHLIFSIIIDATNKLTGKKSCGKLSFIDLAGSESSKKTGTDKEGLAEANAINQSLSALGNVISALADGAKFIRYKENLLTRLMQDSLGGNSKTLMFVNCSPSVYNEMETKNSLEYAKRVKEIKNNPMQNFETKAIQNAQKTIEAQQLMIDSLKGLAQDNGLAEKLAEVLAQFEKEDQESSSVFSLSLDAVKADDKQIKEKPATGRKSNELGRQSTLKTETHSRPSMRPSQSGPIKTFKK